MVYPSSQNVVHFVRLYPCTMYGVCQCSLHIPYCFCCGTNVYCLPTEYGNLICYKVCILLLNQVSCVPVFPLVSYMNMHIPIVLCCGAKRVLFTNKLSEYWCHIIKPYLFTKFHTSKHLGKRVTQTSMFTLFFVVVRKGYCLPTSYQNVGVISLIPTCLPSFIHPSI